MTKKAKTKKRQKSSKVPGASPKLTQADKVRLLQRALNISGAVPPLVEDGSWGPLSQAAFDQLVHGIKPDDKIHAVIATSFADPADVAAFMACKDKSHTDAYCFKFGDNGEGAWGDDTKKGSGAACALPPETMIETWGSVDNARGAKVMVHANGSGVLCRVKDKMPHRANITNGSGIDLNYDACATLGLRPPVKTRATWQSV